MTANNSNIDLDNIYINWHIYIWIYKIGEIWSILFQDIEKKKEILTPIKGHYMYSVTNLRNNDRQRSQPRSCQYDYIKIGKIMPICPQDIERKQNSGGNQRPYFGRNVQKMMCNNPKLDLVSDLYKSD